jgi:predicted TIM-barrel enzyme
LERDRVPALTSRADLNILALRAQARSFAASAFAPGTSEPTEAAANGADICPSQLRLDTTGLSSPFISTLSIKALLSVAKRR